VSQVRQIIMNLVINASEAIGESSGVITMSTGLMECTREYLSESYLQDELPDGSYVYLEVDDTGCGMSEEVRSRIFEPFFSTKFTGRGLGLAAVLGIVRGHRGAIKVSSDPGWGTCVRVLFPISQVKAAVEERAAPGPPRLQGEGTLLVVDDEEVVRVLSTRILERAGFTVLLAKDGKEAVEVFEAHAQEIRLVLLDLTMPLMDGEEVFRQMCRIRSDVRAILSSGYSEQDATERFTNLGLAGFLQKPYTADLLMEAVSKALR